MADATLYLPETQLFYEMQEKGLVARKFADMFSVPDKEGHVGEATDVTSVMRVHYNDGSSTRIHTSEEFNYFFEAFLKDNAEEMVSRTMQKAVELTQKQQLKAAQEVEAKLNFSQYIPGTGSGPVSSVIPMITSPILAVAFTNDLFVYYITATAPTTDPVTSYTASGLPTGLTLNATTGMITGSVSVAGNYMVMLNANNSAGTGHQVLQITVADASTPATPSTGTPPTIYGPMAATAQEGVPFNFALNASNLPTSGFISWNATGLPTGLAVSGNAITGTPATGTAASSPYTVKLTVTTADGSDDETLVLTVNP